MQAEPLNYFKLFQASFYLLLTILYLINDKKTKKRKSIKLDALQKIQDFTLTEYFISCDGTSAIGLDMATKKLCHIDYDNKFTILANTDITESAILEDNQIVFKKSVNRTFRITDSKGTINQITDKPLDSFSDTMPITKKVKQIKLRVSNLNSPDLEVLFLNEPSYVRKKNFLSNRYYNKAIDKAIHWHELISVLINFTDRDAQKKIT